MKGTLFLRPAEYRLDVQGEQWRQGENIAGTLQVVNHGQTPLALSGIGVALARGEVKKLKNDSNDGLSDLQEAVYLEMQTIAPGASAEVNWQFQLEKNCAITDKKESLYVRFGNIAKPDESKFLQLPIIPRAVFDHFLETLVNFYRFKIKEKKNAKGRVEAVLIPPQSREFSTIDSLSCFLQETNDEFSIDYKFKVKTLEYAGAAVQDVKVEKKSKDISQVFKKRDYLLYGDTANMDFFIKKIGEALESAKPKLL